MNIILQKKTAMRKILTPYQNDVALRHQKIILDLRRLMDEGYPKSVAMDKVARKYKVRSKTTIYNIIKKYGNGDDNS